MSKRSNRARPVVAQTVEPATVEQVTIDPATVTDANVTIDPATVAVEPETPSLVTVDEVLTANLATAHLVTVAPVVAPVPWSLNRATMILRVNTRIHGRNDHWSQTGATVNAIPIPKGNGLCATAWYMFDDMYATPGCDLTTATIVEVGATQYGLNRGNLRTEISRYRKYHGYARPVAQVTLAPVTVATVEPAKVELLRTDANGTLGEVK